MAGKLVCWQCGESLRDLAKPMSRLAQCRECGADLHVCRLCRFYNPHILGRCEHEFAEPPREVHVANFCQYFKPKPNAYQPDRNREAEAAKAELKDIFGDAPGETDQAQAEPDDPMKQLKELFGERDDKGDGNPEDDR